MSACCCLKYMTVLTYATAAVPHVHYETYLGISSFGFILIIYFSGVSAVCRLLVSTWFIGSIGLFFARFPIFSLRRKIPACRGMRGILPAQCRQPVQLAEHATEIAEKTPVFMLLFRSSFHKHAPYMLTFAVCFVAGNYGHPLHCIPQVQALKVLTLYDKKTFYTDSIQLSMIAPGHLSFAALSLLIFRGSRPKVHN